ncbi:MetQ/NlpA family ABC transporter substrate-binding protein [Raineyella sp. W15-4]|uniref:MetQ/NlpA family ABC transporter substrate-binding protein n=1 Tax=Raineyella sp. W15-4 TaxID=3081651 RepID=UPI002955ADD4|nr:MetQ/NlpA family ABC transporter substrate-binding protein [Raineyella sp. W15-4]WOQ18087.1 MetQ/NlpA family ABC transporter substrate-binding protein [Raineyella sp. W15-4]
MSFRKIAAGFSVLLVLLAAACSSGSGAPAGGGSSAQATVKIGVADGGEPYWQVFKQKAKDAGITVDFVNFSDYNQPNPALSQKQLDLNEFQHLQYLAQYNVKNNDTLTPIGATAVYPLPLYSTKYKTPADIPANGKVAIPNDPTNQARALLVLQSAGLLTLKNGGNSLSTPADVATSKVTVVPIDASQTAQNLPSVEAAVVNNNYATAAKLSKDNIIYADDVNADQYKPYINVFVARAADKDNPTYLKLAQLYHDPEVEAAIVKDLGGDGVFKTNSATDLQATLKSIQDNIAQAGK